MRCGRKSRKCRVPAQTVTNERDRPCRSSGKMAVEPVLSALAPLPLADAGSVGYRACLSQRGGPGGSVRAHASKYSLCFRTDDDLLSRGFQDGQHRHAAAEELEPAAIGGNVLIVARARAEKVAEFIVSPANRAA